MAGGRLVNSIGRILDKLGRHILVSTAMACDACCGALSCGSIETCQNWCLRMLAEYMAAHGCGCACPGFLAYPAYYTVLIGNARPKVGELLKVYATNAYPFPQYIKIESCPVLTGYFATLLQENPGGGTVRVCSDTTVNFIYRMYQSDGVTEITENPLSSDEVAPFTGTFGLQFPPQTRIAVCGDTGFEGLDDVFGHAYLGISIFNIGNITVGFCDPRIQVAGDDPQIPADQIPTIDIDSGIIMKGKRCFDSLMGFQPIQGSSDGTGNFGDVILDPAYKPFMRLTPTCYYCGGEGTPPQTTIGNAALCGAVLEVVGAIWKESLSDYLAFDVVCDHSLGPALWYGTGFSGGVQHVVTIQQVRSTDPTDKCCPRPNSLTPTVVDHNCDDGCGDDDRISGENGCSACWMMTIVRADGVTIKMYSSIGDKYSCPPTDGGAWRLDGHQEDTTSGALIDAGGTGTQLGTHTAREQFVADSPIKDLALSYPGGICPN